MGTVSINTDTINANTISGYDIGHLYVSHQTITDCNDATNPGTYAVMDPFTNSPVNTYGLLTVEVFTGGWLYQSFIATANKSEKWVRMNINNTGWADWYILTCASRNLLDNPFFQINQRESNTYTAKNNAGTMCVDRWALSMSDSSDNDNTVTLTVLDNGIKIEKPSDSGIWWLTERFDTDTWNMIAGKTVHFAILTNVGVFRSTLIVPADTNFDSGASSKYGLNVNIYYGTFRIFSALNSVEIYGVSFSLRALDIERPDYGAELLKCKRYYQRIYGHQLYRAGKGAGTVYSIRQPIQEMRATPTVTFNIQYSGCTKNGVIIRATDNATIAANYSVSWYTSSKMVVIDVSVAENDATSQHLYVPKQESPGSYIELSADI